MSHNRPPYKAETEIGQRGQSLPYHRFSANQRSFLRAQLNEMLTDLDDTRLADVFRLASKHHAEHCPHCY